MPTSTTPPPPKSGSGQFVGAAIIMLLKNYVSAYIERWNMLMGFVFVLIVIFMPEGVVPGLRRLVGRLRAARGGGP